MAWAPIALAHRPPRSYEIPSSPFVHPISSHSPRFWSSRFPLFLRFAEGRRFDAKALRLSHHVPFLPRCGGTVCLHDGRLSRPSGRGYSRRSVTSVFLRETNSSPFLFCTRLYGPQPRLCLSYPFTHPFIPSIRPTGLPGLSCSFDSVSFPLQF